MIRAALLLAGAAAAAQPVPELRFLPEPHTEFVVTVAVPGWPSAAPEAGPLLGLRIEDWAEDMRALAAACRAGSYRPPEIGDRAGGCVCLAAHAGDATVGVAPHRARAMFAEWEAMLSLPADWRPPGSFPFWAGLDAALTLPPGQPGVVGIDPAPPGLDPDWRRRDAWFLETRLRPQLLAMLTAPGGPRSAGTLGAWRLAEAAALLGPDWPCDRDLERFEGLDPLAAMDVL